MQIFSYVSVFVTCPIHWSSIIQRMFAFRCIFRFWSGKILCDHLRSCRFQRLSFSWPVCIFGREPLVQSLAGRKGMSGWWRLLGVSYERHGKTNFAECSQDLDYQEMSQSKSHKFCVNRRLNLGSNQQQNRSGHFVEPCTSKNKMGLSVFLLEEHNTKEPESPETKCFLTNQKRWNVLW